MKCRRNTQRVERQWFQEQICMKSNHNIKSIVRSRFADMQTKQDFLDLLNLVRIELLGLDSHPFKMSQLTWYYNSNISGNQYRKFTIKKKSGKDRLIHAPVKGLKYIQRVLAFILECQFEPHINSYGFTSGKSIVDNARRHANSRYILNIDLKDFFPSIDQPRVWKCFQLKPLNLKERNNSNDIIVSSKSFVKPFGIYINNSFSQLLQSLVLKTDFIDYKFTNGSHKIFDHEGEKIIYNVIPDANIKFSGSITIVRSESSSMLVKEGVTLTENNLELVLSKIISHQKDLFKKSRLQLASIFASLCCTSMEVQRKNEEGIYENLLKNVLPQGAPTSPIVTNIICQRLDFLLTGLSNRFGIRYTRYADDITFSSNHNVYREDGDFFTELRRIIKDQKFEINESKTRLQKVGFRQEVTGLLVNVQPNVQKRYIKQLRSWVYIWEKYGYKKATNLILTSYLKDKGHVKSDKVKIESLIRGKLDYLKMVKGSNSQLYLKLFSRFADVFNNDLQSNVISNSKFDLATKIGKKSNIDFVNSSNHTDNYLNLIDDDITNNFVLKMNQNPSTNNFSEIIENIIEIGLDSAMDKYKP